jgi:hypothetical protein
MGYFNSSKRARQAGYRSGLEENIAFQLSQAGVRAAYEPCKIPYTVPETKHTYTPDYILPNGIVIESKGRFTLEDRKKHIYLKEQYPDMELRFVFSNSNARLRKGAKSTYADWCSKHGFDWSDKLIPKEWLEEKLSASAVKLVEKLRENV